MFLDAQVSMSLCLTFTKRSLEINVSVAEIFTKVRRPQFVRVYISIFVKHKLNDRALNQQFEWVNQARFWNKELDALFVYLNWVESYILSTYLEMKQAL